jgi:hypothetical protein
VDPLFRVKFSFSTNGMNVTDLLGVIVKDDGFFKDSVLGVTELQLGELIDSRESKRCR